MDRRSALRLLATAPLATAFSCTGAEAARAQRAVSEGYAPKFFTDAEYGTVRRLVDLILPADERSGSATDAGVPEFMDFLMDDQPERRTAMRGGLAWLDAESLDRFGRRFVDATDAERSELLDAVAYPGADAELSHGVEFFSRFRDLTATGFFTSRMGFEDLQYLGNEHVTAWTGCPPEALEKLGLPRQ